MTSQQIKNLFACRVLTSLLNAATTVAHTYKIGHPIYTSSLVGYYNICKTLDCNLDKFWVWKVEDIKVDWNKLFLGHFSDLAGKENLY